MAIYSVFFLLMMVIFHSDVKCYYQRVLGTTVVSLCSSITFRVPNRETTIDFWWFKIHGMILRVHWLILASIMMMIHKEALQGCDPVR